MFKKLISKFKNAYVVSHAQALKLPEFKDEGRVRLNYCILRKSSECGLQA